MRIQVAYNLDNDELYCVECKSKIKLGEKYIIIYETVYNEVIKKPVHCECIEESEE